MNRFYLRRKTIVSPLNQIRCHCCRCRACRLRGCPGGCAAWAAGVLLVAMDLDKIAAMPCSPSIGGMAKGQLVKEVDALGGEMARVTDRSAIQYRLLNTKKGPAVHSSRTQNDKMRYHLAMKQVVENQPNLTLKQTMVERLVVEDGRIAGLEDRTGFGYQARNGCPGNRYPF